MTAARQHQGRVVAARRGVKGALWRAQGGGCPYCLEPLPDLPPTNRGGRGCAIWFEVTLDHVLPIDRDGPDLVDNLLDAHRACNQRKGGRLPYPCELIWLMAVNARLGVGPTEWRCAA